MNGNVKSFIVFGTYSGMILTWYLSWLLVGDGIWWLALVNRAVPYLFIPALPLLAWALFARQLRSSLFLLIPFIIFVVLYYPYLFPKRMQSIDGTPKLKVMTYNVLFSNHDYDSVAGVILDYHPDLVALQEVQPEMMNALQIRLGNEYPYSLKGTQNNFGTTAVFSRYPFEEAQVWDLEIDRPAVAVKVTTPNQPVVFVAAHLLAYNLWWTKAQDIPEVTAQRTTNQNRQANILLNQLEKESGIVIIGCDCNSYETSSSYRILEGFMNNSARQVGWVWNANSSDDGISPDRDLMHIDYIWYHGSVVPLNVYKVKNAGGSDHLPVLAVFRLK